MAESETSSTTATITRKIFHAIGASTSITVSGTFFLALVYYRDALMISFFIGAIGNAILGKVLKRILNQERPPELETVTMKLKPSDKGMPSSHAMSLGFIGMFTAWMVPPSLVWIRLPLLLYAFISLWYRIDTKLHTWQQIMVGFVVGSTNGVIWHQLCEGAIGFNMLDWVRQTLLNDQGLLPWNLLVVPAIVGAIIVGSVERRLSGWLQQLRQQKQESNISDANKND